MLSWKPVDCIALYLDVFRTGIKQSHHRERKWLTLWRIEQILRARTSWRAASPSASTQPECLACKMGDDGGQSDRDNGQNCVEFETAIAAPG